MPQILYFGCSFSVKSLLRPNFTVSSILAPNFVINFPCRIFTIKLLESTTRTPVILVRQLWYYITLHLVLHTVYFFKLVGLHNPICLLLFVEIRCSQIIVCNALCQICTFASEIHFYGFSRNVVSQTRSYTSIHRQSMRMDFFLFISLYLVHFRSQSTLIYESRRSTLLL